MNLRYLLPSEPRAIPVISLRRYSHAPPLKINDPAMRAMIDFERDPLLTATEDLLLDPVLDQMFRLGIRTLLVVRESAVTGLLTVDHAIHAHDLEQRRDPSGHMRQELQVADAMIPTADVPAVDLRTIECARISDLLEIFAGSHTQYLVVLQDDLNRAVVRGLISRSHTERSVGGYL